jgi:hypothetical protein
MDEVVTLSNHMVELDILELDDQVAAPSFLACMHLSAALSSALPEISSARQRNS